MKTHLHSEQFDRHMHSHCGRGQTKVVYADEFEATHVDNRCKYCDNYWFPNGQPLWHYEYARENYNAVHS